MGGFHSDILGYMRDYYLCSAPCSKGSCLCVEDMVKIRQNAAQTLKEDTIANLQKQINLELEKYQIESNKTSDEEAEETIAEEASRLVYGPRQEAYDHPFDNFTQTGRMWGAILGIPDISPEKVALCMIAVKLSRECHAHKRDNLVDTIGYTLTLDRVIKRRNGEE